MSAGVCMGVWAWTGYLAEYLIKIATDAGTNAARLLGIN